MFLRGLLMDERVDLMEICRGVGVWWASSRGGDGVRSRRNFSGLEAWLMVTRKGWRVHLRKSMLDGEGHHCCGRVTIHRDAF